MPALARIYRVLETIKMQYFRNTAIRMRTLG
jgi:hypothetical protein